MIYADHAATTAISPAVLAEIWEIYRLYDGNPSSIHRAGREAKKKLEEARRRVAACIGGTVREIYFTSSGTESDNWAVRGMAARMKAAGKREIISSELEHHGVMNPLKALEAEGFCVTRLPTPSDGVLRPEALASRIGPDTGLVTIQYVNQEIGTIQPIREMAEICRRHGVPCHSDAVQGAAHLPIRVQELGVDLLTLSAHKLRGPKGAGLLYVREGISLSPLIFGGGQERGLRAGTENLAGIAGFSLALSQAQEGLAEKNRSLGALRDRLQEALLAIPGSHLNGHREKRVPGHLNLSFEGVEGESLLLMLDMAGICVSSGSACTSGATEPSHVLKALGHSNELANGSVRISLGEENTPAEIQEIAAGIRFAVEKLRTLRGWGNGGA